MQIAREILVDERIEKRILPGKKTILYVGIKYDYGHPEWGLSYEHYNFYLTFLNMGYSMIYFDYMTLKERYGLEEMSKMLLTAAYYYNPDVLFYFHYHDWVRRDIWKELPVKKYIWLADDSWRFEATKPVWKLFDTIITTDEPSHKKRKSKSVLSEWACNPSIYRDMNLDRTYDVTFIGRAHGNRKKFVETLRNNGISILTLGSGWESNDRRISQTELINIYNKSKIVLNMSADSAGSKIQVNARDFEATACGAMLLTQDSPAIRKCFAHRLGSEIVTYGNADDAVEKIKLYLGDDEERNRIAHNGYYCTGKNHTYEERFKNIEGLT